jgi:CzcA family heavy metal efflux pump
MSRLALRYEKVIVFLVAVLTVLGVWSYTTIPASIFPTMSFARVDVVADAGDLPPDRVRIGVTLPLERAMMGLPSVTRVVATSAQGNAEVIVEFDPHTDVNVDLQRVFQGIASARADMPAGTLVDATIINPNSEPILSYAFTSPQLSQTVVRELLQRSVVPAFYGIAGLSHMLVVGGAQREYTVTLNGAAMAAVGLSPGDVSKAIADANAVSSPGYVNEYSQRTFIVLDSRIDDADSLARVRVPIGAHDSIPLGAIAAVRLGTAPPTDQMSYDATHAVALNFYALPGADTVKMADVVEARMSQLATRLPGGVAAHLYWDQTALVRDSQKSLRDAIAIGAVLAILVIFIFLRSVRMTLIAAVIIPIAVAVVLFAIGQFGQTLNLMSVGGVAVAVGLIIDDAIVVIENIARNLHDRPDLGRADAIELSMRELIAPMTASTITTVVVFLPLALLSGVSGFFFRALAVTLATSLIVSLLLAIFVTPILALRFVRGVDERALEAGWISRVLARYEPVLRWALIHRRTVYVASGVVLALTVVLLLRLPSDFLPVLDEGQFEIKYSMPVGATLEASDAAATALERIALRDPAVAKVGRVTGIDTNGFSPTPPRVGTIRITLKARSQRDRYEAVSDRLRDAMQSAVPAAALDIHQILEDMINDLSGAPAPIQVTLRGPDQATLIDLASGVSDRFAKLSGITDVFSGVSYDDPAVRISPDESRLAALGIGPADLADALGASSQGNVATQVAAASQLVPVRVRIDVPSAGFGSQLVPTGSGAVALPLLAQTEPAAVSSDITEENGVRVMVVTANYVNMNLSAAIAEIRSAIAKTPLPPGYSYSIGGEYEAQQDSFREFATVIAIAIALVFFVMLATFRSYRLPAVILTAIPLALIGVVLGLYLTQTPFNVSSFMGLLLLVGLIVKNGILLIDVANRRRESGAGIDEALLAAGRLRLRPIVMTTFAAIGGLLPLALGLGAGAEMEKPLAIAVIGGLSTATAFTLIAIPVLYAGFSGKERLT